MLPKHAVKKIYGYQIVTLGFYFFYWCIRSRREINDYLKVSAVPSPWWLIVPLGAFWWMWQYTMALSTVSRGQIKQADTYLLFILVGFGWDIALDAFQSLPTSILKLFLPSHLVNIGLIVIGYISVVLVFGFYCAYVQGKINDLKPLIDNQPGGSPV